MNKKGFTLVELMVVIIIMSIVTMFVLNILSNISEREIVKIRENAQVVIDEAKKLKEQNIDVKVKVKQASPEPKKDEKKAEAPKIETPKQNEQTKPPEGLKPL